MSSDTEAAEKHRLAPYSESTLFDPSHEGNGGPKHVKVMVKWVPGHVCVPHFTPRFEWCVSGVCVGDM